MKRNGAGFAGNPSANETNIYLMGEGITNRHLLGQNVGWDWNSEFEFLAGLKEKMEKEISILAPEGRNQNLKKIKSCFMSSFINEARTYFQKKPKDFS